MIELIIALLILWISGLTTAVILLNINLKNQSNLIQSLRNELNSYKAHHGHIFCKSVDDDFDCSAVRKFEISKVKKND